MPISYQIAAVDIIDIVDVFDTFDTQLVCSLCNWRI